MNHDSTHCTEKGEGRGTDVLPGTVVLRAGCILPLQ